MIQPEFKNQKFLLAISGGVDSMVLLNLCKGLPIEVAHINYKLRGKDSDLDQKLVEKICRENEIPFHLYQVSEKDKKPENSIQDWARILRYNFFKKIRKEQGLDFTVTAHHLNDNLETFIINLSKASGIKGLSGIPANENKILRPLLSFTKDEIYAFANENNIEFREDLSNQKSDYLRNKIRNEVVPNLMKVNKNFLENFGKSISYFNQTKDFVQDIILKIEKEITYRNGDSIRIDKEKLFRETNFTQYEILRKYGFQNANEIKKMQKAETGKKFISSEFEILIEREFVIINRLGGENFSKKEVETILHLDSENEIIIPTNEKNEIAEFGTIQWKIDGDKIQLPLKLRQKKESDLFQPIGMMGKKKVSKFFKDEKIPIFDKKKCRILVDNAENILGILPYRQDGRFAATNKTKNLLKIFL